MPFGDGTGPLGQGPRTGRGLGRCAGAGMGAERGRGRGLGFCRLAGAVDAADEQQRPALISALESLLAALRQRPSA